jgi:hypothetical protein
MAVTAQSQLDPFTDRATSSPIGGLAVKTSFLGRKAIVAAESSVSEAVV